MDIEAAVAALSHLEIDRNPASLKAKSRDFFWYSPVLKARLDQERQVGRVREIALAPEQLAAKLLLELFDGARQRRLGDVTLLCGSGEIQ